MQKIKLKIKFLILSTLAFAVCVGVIAGVVYLYLCTPSLIDRRMDGGQVVYTVVGVGLIVLVAGIVFSLILWGFFKRNVLYRWKKMLDMETTEQEDEDHHNEE